MELPTITKEQTWCCSEGCGDCKPVPTDFEYFRSEDIYGNIETKTQKIWVSDCCKAELMLWDEEKQDNVDFNFVEGIVPQPND